MPTKPDNSKYWQELISWKFWLHTIIVDAILAAIWFGVNKLITMQPIIRDIGFLILLIAGLFAVAWYLPKFTAKRQGDNLIQTKTETPPTPQSKIEIYPTSNKLLLVVQAIAKAKQIIPKGNDVIVYPSDDFLNTVNIEELHSILLKLQNDEKILKIKYFPKHLLPTFPFKFTHEMLNQDKLDALDPTRRQFRVKTSDKFDGFAKQLGVA